MRAAPTPLPGITLLGLGPGDPALLTRRAWDLLQAAPELYVRTRAHPTLAGLPPHLPIHSFDSLYETAENFEEVYNQIIETVLARGRRPQGVIYAVPGHPFVAEATCPAIYHQARAEGLPVRVVEGLSFLDPVFTALGLDPFPRTSLLDAFELAAAHAPPFPPDSPALIAQLHSNTLASDVKLALMAVYPDEHPVRLVHAAGTEAERIEDLPLYAIDRSPSTGLLTCLYLPPLEPYTSFEAFQEIIAHLRAPEGCPWDREQTHASLRPYLLEETYETLEALDAADPEALREELGDLLLQIVLHAQIASEVGEFTFAEVVRGIATKLIRRHPHVFSDVEVEGVGGVLQNWERLKAEERAARGEAAASIFDGVPKAQPALAQAAAYQDRAARVGFDWPEIQGVYDKIAEELEELRTAPEPAARARELGDLLFAITRLAGWLDIDPETALRETNARFRRRFAHLEKAARDRGAPLAEFTIPEFNRLWEEAKAAEEFPPEA